VLTPFDAATRAAARLSRDLKRWNLIVSAFIAFIAVLLGLKIWAADPTWGEVDDFLAAVLWGLGLHQFTFDGISGLAAKVMK
jgi:hypothetical protein